MNADAKIFNKIFKIELTMYEKNYTSRPRAIHTRYAKQA